MAGYYNKSKRRYGVFKKLPDGTIIGHGYDTRDQFTDMCYMYDRPLNILPEYIADGCFILCDKKIYPDIRFTGKVKRRSGNYIFEVLIEGEWVRRREI